MYPRPLNPAAVHVRIELNPEAYVEDFEYEPSLEALCDLGLRNMQQEGVGSPFARGMATPSQIEKMRSLSCVLSVEIRSDKHPWSQ